MRLKGLFYFYGRKMIYKFFPANGETSIIIPIEAIHESDWSQGHYKVYANEFDWMEQRTFLTYDDYLGWQTAEERKIWLVENLLDTRPGTLIPVMNEETPKDHINPSHYQGYVQELQWLETMQYLPRFRNPESFIAAVELQGRKYWDRNGGKDEEEQELQKGIWYFKFLLAYIKNGRKPIRVADINRLIGDMGQGAIE
jgi:hypothetical protein